MAPERRSGQRPASGTLHRRAERQGHDYGPHARRRAVPPSWVGVRGEVRQTGSPSSKTATRLSATL